MQENILKLLMKILKIYGIQVSHQSIEQTILTHPAYPSMQCISDALDGWQVKHVVLNLTMEKLRALEVPVLAHLRIASLRYQ